MDHTFVHGYKGNMTKKEYILDCLADGSEAKAQIVEYFEFVKVDISSNEIDHLIEEMIKEDLIIIDRNWLKEFGEKSYSMTQKGRVMWENRVPNGAD